MRFDCGCVLVALIGEPVPRTDPAETILHGSDPDEILAACAWLAGEELHELDEVVPAAIAGGGPAAIHAYVSAARRLIRRLLAGVHESQPDLAVAGAGFFESFLELGALEAPFSPWVNRYGPGKGSALFFVSRLRTALPGSRPLPVPKRDAVLPHWEALGPEEFARFVRRVSELLPVWSDSIPQLERVRQLFALSNSELGRLFGASRQAATVWLEKGVPPARLPKLKTVLNIAELLQRKLKPGRLPAVARSKAPAYKGRSMLEMIAQDEHETLLEDVRATFDWAATA